jgi:polysaccharide export outer membrane protein
MRRVIVFFIYIMTLLTLFVLASGCAANRPTEEPGTQGQQSQDGFAQTEGEYRVGVDDRLQISVWKNPELSITVPVRPDGMISMPLIGDVKAGGLTATQSADNIKQRLAAYIRDPSVAVIVVDLRSHEFISRVRVTGAVRTPRSLPFRQGLTVVDAVLEAGGVNEFAAPNRAKLYRKVKGVTEVYDVELGDILSKGRLETNYPLQPGDVVTVPERLF